MNLLSIYTHSWIILHKYCNFSILAFKYYTYYLCEIFYNFAKVIKS